MKARLPDESGAVDRDGVRIHWDRYGDGDATVALLPTWALLPSEHWKFQVPFLARRFRVLVVEGRGRGRSDTPRGSGAFAIDEYVADVVAVLDATETERAVLAGLSRGAMWALGTAAGHPDRVHGVVAIGPAVPVGDIVARDSNVFEAQLDSNEGWAKYNARYWQHQYPDFVEFFVGQMFAEGHSTKALDDCLAWGTSVDAATMLDATRQAHIPGDPWFGTVVGAVRCPVLVVHGSADRVRPHSAGAALAELTGGDLVTIVGAGHAPHLRDPVFVNCAIRDFVDRIGAGRRSVGDRAA